MINKPTMRDVAKQANVSVATVSRVINGLGGYSKDTEELVKKVIKEMNFEANAIARSLSVKSSKIIGVLLPETDTGVFVEVLRGIEKTARENGYSVIICNTGKEGMRTLEYLKVLLANQVAGIIYGSSPLFDKCFELMESSHVPCVLALTLTYKYQIPYVKVDDKLGVYDATNYLIQMGHKKIAFISGSYNDPIAGVPRIEGYISALSDNGIALNENIIKYGDFGYESGRLCMEQLLAGDDKFTAVFAASDDMAVGAMNVLHSRGIMIPEDISVMGYDNTIASRISYPNLTTLAQPLALIGQTSTEKLLEIIKFGKKAESCFLAHNIIERDTVKKIL